MTSSARIRLDHRQSRATGTGSRVPTPIGAVITGTAVVAV